METAELIETENRCKWAGQEKKPTEEDWENEMMVDGNKEKQKQKKIYITLNQPGKKSDPEKTQDFTLMMTSCCAAFLNDLYKM